jgi:hypothetical protein
MAEDKKTGLFAQLFGKDDRKKKKSCCCCGSFEIEEIEGPENNNTEDQKEDTKTN